MPMYECDGSTSTFGARANSVPEHAPMPDEYATADPPSSAPTASSNACHVGVPIQRA